MLVAEPDADLELALVEWRRFRRQKRLADIHWIDALYRAYLTGILGFAAVVMLAGAVGDQELAPGELHDVLQRGPAWLGGLAAVAVAMGLRSGSRGGPLALERAEVRHVLLAPVDRSSALRGPAVKQLRFLFFVAAVLGGIAGELASHRLEGNSWAWAATGALGGLTLVALGGGAAYVTGALRVPKWLASVLGFGLVAVALLHATEVLSLSPTEPFGRLLLWPLEFDALGLVPIGVGLVLLGLGLALVGVVSLESAERRSTLVGQLRFAATMQDLRTVLVLRRQLALELPRRRPWIRLRVKGTGRFPIFVRGLRGILRWPAARVARLLILGIVAGAALRGAWTGTSPLIVASGIAAFLCGLDGIEPLAQEVDHPSRRDASPLEPGAIHLAHLPVCVLVMALTGGIAAVAAAVPGPGQVPVGVAAVLVIPFAMGGVGGAVVSVLASKESGSEAWTMAPVEAQGMRVAFRAVWPPAIAVLGSAPVLAARVAVEDGNPGPAAAASAAFGVAVLFALVCGWVRVRDRIAEWWRSSMEQANGNRSTTDG